MPKLTPPAIESFISHGVQREEKKPAATGFWRVQAHKLPIAAYQLYLPKKVAMTVAFMVSKAKSGCATKEHWKGKEEYIRLHLKTSQMMLEWWGKRDCALFFNLSQSSHAASSSHGQLVSPEEMVFGLWHSHGLIFLLLSKIYFLPHKAKISFHILISEASDRRGHDGYRCALAAVQVPSLLF